MEAIIRTENKCLFEALLHFLKSLNITVETKEQNNKAILKEKAGRRKQNQILNEFQKLLLNGPIMNDEEYNYFKEKKLNFNKMTSKV
ncbi:MAG: hypothetical protein A2X08_10220 [Bacteroidetes bacterium GWA2_32_17]|nr:MAG: hypothetical protein A2X08_10220 [Bacteroidetes bacterium GWA2_32_17]